MVWVMGLKLEKSIELGLGMDMAQSSPAHFQPLMEETVRWVATARPASTIMAPGWVFMVKT